MESMSWTDARLEERLTEINRRFDGVDRRLDAVDQRLDRVEAEVAELRREMHAGFLSLQSTLHRAGIAIIVTLIGGLISLVGGVLALVATQGV